ncbi:MAG: NAD(P)H-dependent oxidoreductase [Bradyrhizobiaceae bacterium]|nr:NAD(P)H-dependent oxidoreductase [Bradyrhizobiaceae bacterium]
MPVPRILVFGGSIRTGSFSAQLAGLATKELALLDAEVTLISLADYPLPIYDGDLEAQKGVPENAKKLRALMNAHRGIYIATPEYNASVPPLLKNTLDWVSRSGAGGEDPYKRCIFAIGATSNGRFGGMRALLALRYILEAGLHALVIPEQVALSHVGQAFDESGNLKDEAVAKLLRASLNRLIAVCQAEI